MMKAKFILPALPLILASSSAIADDAPKLQVTPSGRILMDGALYASPQKEQFPDGMAIPEVRLGAKFKYGNWSANIDMGYAYAKLGLRNIWLEYGFNNHSSIRFGNFIHQFGLQSTSLSLKSTFEQPLASALFTPGLQLGVMYVNYTPAFYGAVSAHVESSARTNVMNAPLFNQQGYGLLTRLVWRTASEGAPAFHAGISGGFATPQRRLEGEEDMHDGFTLSANFPTKVVQETAVSATVDKAMNSFKFSPELLFAYDRFAFEGQYFFQQINRRENLAAYHAQSGYASLRGILFGDRYRYVSSTAQVANPKNNTLECVVNYNYATLSDSKANIFGGRANGFNVTFNYYFNPYITARLNYSYTHVWNREGHDPMTLNGFQARLMLLF